MSIIKNCIWACEKHAFLVPLETVIGQIYLKCNFRLKFCIMDYDASKVTDLPLKVSTEINSSKYSNVFLSLVA